jgi:hypothetical protein
MAAIQYLTQLLPQVAVVAVVLVLQLGQRQIMVVLAAAVQQTQMVHLLQVELLHLLDKVTTVVQAVQPQRYHLEVAAAAVQVQLAQAQPYQEAVVLAQHRQ